MLLNCNKHKVNEMNPHCVNCVFQANLESTYQELLSTLNQLSGCIHDNSEMTYNLDIMNTYDVNTVKEIIQNIEVSFHTLFSLCSLFTYSSVF